MAASRIYYIEEKKSGVHGTAKLICICGSAEERMISWLLWLITVLKEINERTEEESEEA